MNIQNGMTVKDSVSGFEGVCSGITDYWTGCTRILIVPLKLDDKGNPAEGQWVDYECVEIVDASIRELPNQPAPSRPTLVEEQGDDAPAPKRASHGPRPYRPWRPKRQHGTGRPETVAATHRTKGPS